MSTEMETAMKRHSVVKFWGGNENGVMMQVTTQKQRKGTEEVGDTEGYIQLDLTEATELYNTLQVFIKEEAKRRQELLKAEIEGQEVFQKTIFEEIAKLNLNMLPSNMIQAEFVCRFAPKYAKQHTSEPQ